ncbi:hypothetical protein ACQFYA_20985 [Promicromonospora sp. Marseille-Q5078]
MEIRDYASPREIRDELRVSRWHRLALVAAVALCITSAAIMFGLLAWTLLAVMGAVPRLPLPTSILVNIAGAFVAIVCLRGGLHLTTWNIGCTLSRSEARDLRALMVRLEQG